MLCLKSKRSVTKHIQQTSFGIWKVSLRGRELVWLQLWMNMHCCFAANRTGQFEFATGPSWGMVSYSLLHILEYFSCSMTAFVASKYCLYGIFNSFTKIVTCSNPFNEEFERKRERKLNSVLPRATWLLFRNQKGDIKWGILYINFINYVHT